MDRVGGVGRDSQGDVPTPMRFPTLAESRVISEMEGLSYGSMYWSVCFTNLRLSAVSGKPLAPEGDLAFEARISRHGTTESKIPDPEVGACLHGPGVSVGK